MLKDVQLIHFIEPHLLAANSAISRTQSQSNQINALAIAGGVYRLNTEA